MDYEQLKKAVDTLEIITRISKKDLKKKYLKLAKKYHPDMPLGSEKKFKELKDSYELLCLYMDSYCFLFDKSEYKNQSLAFANYKNWNN